MQPNHVVTDRHPLEVRGQLKCSSLQARTSLFVPLPLGGSRCFNHCILSSYSVAILSGVRQVIDVAAHRVVHSFGDDQHQVPIQTLAVSVDGQWIAVGDCDNNICIYNMVEFSQPHMRGLLIGGLLRTQQPCIGNYQCLIQHTLQ